MDLAVQSIDTQKVLQVIEAGQAVQVREALEVPDHIEVVQVHHIHDRELQAVQGQVVFIQGQVQGHQDHEVDQVHVLCHGHVPEVVLDPHQEVVGVGQ